MAKRYGNILAFALPIMKDEVNTVDFMLIEGVRVFYPELHSVIKTHPGAFTGEEFVGQFASERQKKLYSQIIETGLVGLSAEDAKRLHVYCWRCFQG